MSVSMSEQQQSANKAATPRPQKVLVEYVEALHRIIKIGTYYPQGHAALDRAAHLFQHSLQKIAEDKKSAGIELKGTSLVVEDQEITLNSPALTEVKTLFRDLGIGRIEIDRAVPLKDLLQLIRTLLQHRSQLQGVKQFTKASSLISPPLSASSNRNFSSTRPPSSGKITTTRAVRVLRPCSWPWKSRG
jgi:hypothetical protein